MNLSNRVLLASHGTDGAVAAEQQVLHMCHKGSVVHHLHVVPEFWKGMTGDDWLNNGLTRNRFREYLETELESEVKAHVSRLKTEAEENDLHYTSEVVVGEPENCLLEVSQREKYDLIVMGSPRPKGKHGLRSRMKTETLVHNLSTPLLIVPYPEK